MVTLITYHSYKMKEAKLKNCSLLKLIAIILDYNKTKKKNESLHPIELYMYLQIKAGQGFLIY